MNRGKIQPIKDDIVLFLTTSGLCGIFIVAITWATEIH